jgi:hypothetical protein
MAHQISRNRRRVPRVREHARRRLPSSQASPAQMSAKPQGRPVYSKLRKNGTWRVHNGVVQLEYDGTITRVRGEPTSLFQTLDYWVQM